MQMGLLVAGRSGSRTILFVTYPRRRHAASDEFCLGSLTMSLVIFGELMAHVKDGICSLCSSYKVIALVEFAFLLIFIGEYVRRMVEKIDQTPRAPPQEFYQAPPMPQAAPVHPPPPTTACSRRTTTTRRT